MPAIPGKHSQVQTVVIEMCAIEGCDCDEDEWLIDVDEVDL